MYYTREVPPMGNRKLITISLPPQAFRQSDDTIILMYLEFGMAQKYVDDLSRSVKRGLRTKVEKSWYPGVAPFGYLNNTTKEKGEKDVVPDPDRFALVRRMWDLMLTGVYTPPQILGIANTTWRLRTRSMRKIGGNPLARSAIYRIFSDPFYYGWFEYPRGSGQWFKGTHVPMITQGEFERVQALLHRNGNPRAVAHSFPFSGLIQCGHCGATVTAEEKHQLICSVCRLKFVPRGKEGCPACGTPIVGMQNPTILDYTYYHCTKRRDADCPERSIEAAALEQQIEDYLSHIEIAPRVLDWMRNYLRKYHEQETAGRVDIRRAHERAYEDCCKRLNNLIRLKTSPSNATGELLSDEEYARQRHELLREKERLETGLPDPDQDARRGVDRSDRLFVFAHAARSTFSEGDPATKRGIVVAVGSNLTLRSKTLTIEAKTSFRILETSFPRCVPEIGEFEPERYGSITAQSDRFAVGLRPGLRG